MPLELSVEPTYSIAPPPPPGKTMSDAVAVTSARLAALESIRDRLKDVKRQSSDLALLFQNPTTAPKRKPCPRMGVESTLEETPYTNVLAAAATGKVRDVYRLASLRVVVYGLETVGVHIAESLARAGVGNLILFGSGDEKINESDYFNLSMEETYKGWPKAFASIDMLKNVNPDVQVEACSLNLFTRSGISMVQHAILSGTCMQPKSHLYKKTSRMDGDSEDSFDEETDVITCYTCRRKRAEKTDRSMPHRERFVSKRDFVGPFEAPADATNAVNLLVACTENRDEALFLNDLCVTAGVKIIFVSCRMLATEVCTVFPTVSPCLRCHESHVQHFLSAGPFDPIWRECSASLPSTQLVASGLACQSVIELLLGHGEVLETFEKQVYDSDKMKGVIKVAGQKRNPSCENAHCSENLPRGPLEGLQAKMERYLSRNF